jgi:integrase
MNITLRLSPRPRKDGTTAVYYDVAHTLENKDKYRNSIFTDIRVKPQDLSRTAFRVKASVKNSDIINRGLKDLVDKRDTAISKFNQKHFTLTQLENYLKGLSDFETVDDYVHTVIKNSRQQTTYIDYTNVLKAFKRHIEKDAGAKIMWSEFMSYEVLDTFKRNALANGVKGTSINSYFKKIKAIINDAYDKQYIYEKFVFNPKLKCSVRRTPIQTTTSIDFETAIEKVNSIYDAQAIGLYLVMFMCRGFYPADVVSLKKANFNNVDENPILKLCESGFDYITHRRSKTRNRANDDLIIRIDLKLLELIQWLKISFYYTHYGTPQRNLLANFDDDIAIFNYDVNIERTHKNLWDIYQKKIKKLLGISYKTARKTYNTHALELNVSDQIRRILLGHIDPTMLASYDNNETSTIREKVQTAHLDVLNEFKAFDLIDNLFEKIKTLDAPDTIKLESIALNEDALIESIKEFKG